MISEEKLLRKKREIDDAKNSLAELKGEEKALLSQLEKDWGCKTLGEVKKKASKMEEEVDELKESIEELSDKLEEEYIERD